MSRKAEFSNQLTAAQDERLALLFEESAEVIVVVGKIMRHSYRSHDPRDQYHTSNRGLLQNEIGDFMAAVDLLCSSGDLNRDSIERARKDKHAKVREWLHHQPKSLLDIYPVPRK